MKFSFIKMWHLSLLVLGAFFLIGINIVPDYGVSYDENDCRTTGFVNLKYILEKIQAKTPQNIKQFPELNEWINKDYGVGFELPLCLAELFFGLNDSKQIFEFRHLINFVFFFLAVLSLYFTVFAITNKSHEASCFAALLIILTPRMFAESFYNCKDIIFLSSAAFYAFFQVKTLNSNKLFWVVLLAALIGFSTSVRIMGILFWISALLLEIICVAFRLKQFNAGIKNICILFFLAPLISIILFPYLWDSPFSRFLEVFRNMSKFRWEGEMLFNGNIIWSTNLPFYYVPTWILISTPFLYIMFFVIGIFLLLFDNITKIVKKTFDYNCIFLNLTLFLFLGPIVLIILLKSVLYDGWRQCYFIYPFFTIIAAFAFFKLSQTQKIKMPLIFLSGLFFSHILFYMVKNHPHQNLYFNFLAGTNLKNRWEYDYWGLSNSRALKDILKNDGSFTISIGSFSNFPLDRACMLLDPEDRKRVKILSSKENPDYLFNNYRQIGNKTEYDLFQEGYEIYKRYYQGQENYLSIYSKTKQNKKNL